MSALAAEAMQTVVALARAVAAEGEAIGLPYVAASADIGSPDPMRGPDGAPLAETVFRWLDPGLRYWEDRAFALRSAFVHAARASAEPFYFSGGRLATWRPSPVLEAINAGGPIEAFGVGSALIAPAYQPYGVIGAVLWASPETKVDVRAVFEARAAELHLLALKLMSLYAEARLGTVAAPVRLTRREIQCLKWAAAGKTDGDIAQIVQISVPTVRFHVTNAARKLGAPGRSQAIHRAAALGYIGGDGPEGVARPVRRNPTR